MSEANAAAQTSGEILPTLKQYNTWRLKAPGAGISFDGSVSDIRAHQGLLVKWPANASWTMGLRTPSNTQFSKLTFKPYAAKGVFPGTSGVTYKMEFAVNTKGANMPATDAVATFSGTIFHG